MAERKAVNRYYPPDFDPAKHKSINKYRNSHPLRERAKKLSQGILVIRFEMPYNIWCGGCGNHIGMGVRYNAEKKKVGKYYTTPIYRFRMKCHLCDNYIEMETDPKNFDYTIVSGAQRKNQKWDMAENEQVLTEDREAVKKLGRDAMYKLEHGVDDSKKLKKAAPSLSQIAEIQSAKREDYNQNQMLRNKFREEKKKLLTVAASDKALLTKSSLDISLVPETEEDKKLASLLRFSATQSYEEKRQQKRSEIQNRDIFASPPNPSCSSLESPSSSSTQASPANKHSEAHRTLITQVLKKKGPGVFGTFTNKSSPSSCSSCSAGRATRSSIGGTTGFIVTKKRKHGSDSPERQEKKMKHVPDSRSHSVPKGTPWMTGSATSSEGSRTDNEYKNLLPLEEGPTSRSSAGTPKSATSMPASKSQQPLSLQSLDHVSNSTESSPHRVSSHGQTEGSTDMSDVSSTGSDNQTKSTTAKEGRPMTDRDQSKPEGQMDITCMPALPPDEERSSNSKTSAGQRMCGDSLHLLVSCYSSSSESEGEQ